MLTSVYRSAGILVLVFAGLSACATNQQPGSQPQTSSGSVAYDAYGPNRPASDLDSTGEVAIADNSGIFGTTDQISVDDNGPFPDNTPSFDPSLSDLGTDPYDDDISSDAALLAGITLSGDDGTAQFFDANIGPTVYFETNSSELTEKARETLRKQIAWLQLHPDVIVMVEGHTDERGTREYNIALGERRASTVRGYMTALGIDGGRIRKISYGKERPLVPGSDDLAWSQNRRVTTVLDGGTSALSSAAASEPRTAPKSLYDDPLLDPALDALLGTEGDGLSSDILDDPLLRSIEAGS